MGRIPDLSRMTADQVKSTKTKYRTQLCRVWAETGNCPHGEACTFAHGKHELCPDTDGKAVLDRTRRKTQLCRNWARRGRCPYENVCAFAHGRAELQQPAARDVAPPKEVTRPQVAPTAVPVARPQPQPQAQVVAETEYSPASTPPPPVLARRLSVCSEASCDSEDADLGDELATISMAEYQAKMADAALAVQQSAAAGAATKPAVPEKPAGDYDAQPAAPYVVFVHNPYAL